jgi:hypothetical protein
VSTYESTWRHSPEEHHLHVCENLTSVLCVNHQQIIWLKLPITLNLIHVTGFAWVIPWACFLLSLGQYPSRGKRNSEFKSVSLSRALQIKAHHTHLFGLQTRKLNVLKNYNYLRFILWNVIFLNVFNLPIIGSGKQVGRLVPSHHHQVLPSSRLPPYTNTKVLRGEHWTAQAVSDGEIWARSTRQYTSLLVKFVIAILVHLKQQ